jgi:hypothetical protein
MEEATDVPRDYQAEYRRRIARGFARGLTRAQARGHASSRNQKSNATQSKADPQLSAAILEMNRGRSLTAAAKSSRISAERLRRFLVEQRLAQRKKRRWVASDTRPRRVPVMSGGRVHVVIADGFPPAQLAGAHHHAVGEFVRTNDLTFLKPFVGKSVRTVSGRKLILETDPNALHRIASMDSPPFHEIYEIVSPT